jgi:hydrogenase maturation factor
MDDASFDRLWGAIDAECRDLGVSVVTGHTARYAGCSFPWVGAATGMAVGDPEELVRPDGARPGDDLVVTNGPAVEAVGLFATLFPGAVADAGAPLSTARERLDDTGAVRDALVAAAAGEVTAMHDATEGGLLGALEEVTESAGVGAKIDAAAVPRLPGVAATCEALGMNLWRATTSGTLVIAVDPEDTAAVLEAVRERGTAAAAIGSVTEGSGLAFEGEPPAEDGEGSWAVYERLLDASG